MTVTGRWLDQVESLAREAVPAPVFRYIEEGARDEVTAGEAVAAWRSLRLLPRVLHDVREVDTTTTLLGTDVQLPMGIAPMTLQRAADPDGEIAMARAAAAAGVPLVISSNAGSTFAEIAATGVTWWLQLYMPPDRSRVEPFLEQALAADVSALVLTVDTPVVATRYPSHQGSQRVWEMADPSWAGANWSGSFGLEPADRGKAMDLGPDDLRWLGAVTGLPVVVKGVLRADDAQRCAASGASAVWVSNHGGRQLDRTIATALCVQAVRTAVGDEVQVYVDGGVRSGLDVLLAVALGADAAFLGRPMFHALAAGGTDGVVRALAELGSELVESMRLSGCAELTAAEGIVSPDRGFSL